MVGLKVRFWISSRSIQYRLESDHGGIEREKTQSKHARPGRLESDHGGIERSESE